MANLRAVLDTTVAQITAALTAAGLVSGTDFNAFIDMPSVKMMAAISQGLAPSAVSVFDLRTARNHTRWPVLNGKVQVNPTGITSTLSASSINPIGTQTITIGGVLNPFDAVSCVLTQGLNTAAVVYVTQPGETLTSIAAALTGLINTDLTTSPLIGASALGPVITLTNLTMLPIALTSLTGNIGAAIQETMRTQRIFQISVFAQTEAKRELIGNPILTWIGRTQAFFGYEVPEVIPALPSLNGTSWARVMYEGDEPTYNTHMPDIYRWDFLINIEFGVMAIDTLYSVLAPIPRFTLS